MFKKYLFIGILSIVAAAVLFYALQQILTTTTLSKQEVINRVESLYEGQVEDIYRVDTHYRVVFTKGQDVYEVQVEEEKGTFQQLDLIAQRETNVAISSGESNKPNTGNSASDDESKTNSSSDKTANNSNTNSTPPSKPTQPIDNKKPSSTTSSSSSKPNNTQAPNKSPASPVRISEATAKQIALNNMKGEIEDIEFFNTADGGYYIVEVENDNQEASFQIHAVTKKILSVVYDD